MKNLKIRSTSIPENTMDINEWYEMFRNRVAFETVYLPKRGDV